MEIFPAEQIVAKSDLSLLSTKNFVCSDVQIESAPLRKTENLLKKMMKVRKKGNFISVLAIRDPPLSREASTMQVHQILSASTAVYTYATSNVRVRECFFRLFRETTVVADLFELQHVSLEHFDKEEDVGKDSTLIVFFDHDESFASPSLNCARE